MNYSALGRKALHEMPDWFHQHTKQLRQLQSSAIPDINTLPDAFNVFCNITGAQFKDTRGNRCTNDIAATRRIFWAAAIIAYDPLWLHGYNSRMRCRLREIASNLMHANAVWLSQISESLIFEYHNIDEFRMQVDLIVYCIRNGLQCAAA